MIIRFLAIIVTGLAVIAPAAHLFALPGKIHMSADDYFIVQRIYLGWWMVGLFLPAALILNLALAFTVRSDQFAFWLALTAAALIVVNLAIFIVWTQPANSVTENWALRPENWQALAAAMGVFPCGQRGSDVSCVLCRNSSGFARNGLTAPLNLAHGPVRVGGGSPMNTQLVLWSGLGAAALLERSAVSGFSRCLRRRLPEPRRRSRRRRPAPRSRR